MKYNLEISYGFYLKVRIMDSNLISLLTLGIKLCLCLPVDRYSLLLCLILWLGCAVEVSCRICSCREG